MKAFTVKAPWGWAFAHAGKVLENRDFRPHGVERGEPVAIIQGLEYQAAAAAWMVRKGLASPFRISPTLPPGISHYTVSGQPVVPGTIALHDAKAMGAVVAVGFWDRLVTHESELKPEEARWYKPTPRWVGWCFSRVVALPRPIKATGFLGMRELDEHLSSEVRRALLSEEMTRLSNLSGPTLGVTS